MNAIRRLVFVVCSLLPVASLWAATPPGLINYQGVLRDASGAPQTGNFDMVFRFYDLETGGTLLLTDTHNSDAPSGPVAVANGLFTAQLGAGRISGAAEPDLAEVFRDHATVWLEVQVGWETLSPRVRVISSAYAQNAATLQGVVNVDSDSRVGIGAPSSNAKLHVAAEGGFNRYAVAGATDYDSSHAAGVIGYGKNANAAGVIGLGGNQISPPSFGGAGGLFAGDGVGIAVSAVGSTNSFNDGGVFHASNGGSGNAGIFAEGNAMGQPDTMNGVNTGGTFTGYGPLAGGPAESHGVEGYGFTWGSGAAIGLYGWASADGTGSAYSIYANAPGGASPGNKYAGYFNGNVQINGGLRNLAGSAGSSGQILQSTGTNFQWVNPSTISDGDWTISGSNLYSAVSGNVGIGTTTPGYKLDVRGDAGFNNPGGITMLFMQDREAAWTNGTYFSWGYGGEYNCFADAVAVGATTHPANTLEVTGNADFTGNVGIGTSNPLSKLHVETDSNHLARFGYSAKRFVHINHVEDPADGDGQTALLGQRSRTSQNDGTGYDAASSNAAVEGNNLYGDSYSFGVYGTTNPIYPITRTGGVLGYLPAYNAWGSLGYYGSGDNYYGGYFTGTGEGSGFAGQAAGIGLGSFGSLMGGWMKGGQYGLYVSGSRYGLFSHGNAYVNGYQAFIQGDAGAKVVSYSVASPAVEVMAHGTSTLAPGQARVEFPPPFKAMLSENAPVAVFVSPVGQTSQLSVSSTSREGFEVMQAGGRTAEVEISWIAIGLRRGYEHTEIPPELMEADFESNMEKVAFDENNKEESALGLYFDKALHFGPPPDSRSRPEQAAERALLSPPPAVHAGEAPSTTPSLDAEPRPLNGWTAPPSPPVAPGATVLEAAPDVRAGEVLVLVPNDGTALHPCYAPADPMVVGVALADAANGTAPVATSSIALVKADATLYPIAKGDLLVTSANPGHAMKAQPPIEPGTVIGKALENLETGTRLIKVLVMLR